jgi:hypothetical protein
MDVILNASVSGIERWMGSDLHEWNLEKVTIQFKRDVVGIMDFAL